VSFKLFTAAGATVETVDVTAGENLSAGSVIYLSVGAGATTIGRAYLTDADAATTSTTAAILGIVTSLASDGTAGTLVTVQLTGTVAGLSSLTSGKFYGLSSTAGELALTAVLPSIGYATSTTELQLTGEITGLPAIAWTPAAITTRLWLDAADAATITESGGAISAWADKSGNSNNATQGTGSAQPTYGTNVVTFDGTGDYLNLAHGVVPDPAEPSMLFIVTKAASNGECFISNRREVASQSYTFQTDTTVATDLLWYSWGDDITFTPTVTPATLGILGVDLATLPLGFVKFYQNGNLEATKAPYSGTTNAGSEAGTIGVSNPGWATFLDGDIRELIVVMGEPVAATRQKIEGYLAHRWSLEGSLPAGHPYKAAAPTIALTAGAAYQSDGSGDLAAVTSTALGYATSTTSLLIRGQFGSSAPA